MHPSPIAKELRNDTAEAAQKGNTERVSKRWEVG